MTTEGNPSGQAYVEMESKENLKAALKKDGKFMGKRCINGYTQIIFNNVLVISFNDLFASKMWLILKCLILKLIKIKCKKINLSSNLE